MKLIEWEVNEDDYQEQIIIPEAQRDLAAKEGISTENKQKVAARIQNLNTGEIYTGAWPLLELISSICPQKSRRCWKAQAE